MIVLRKLKDGDLTAMTNKKTIGYDPKNEIEKNAFKNIEVYEPEEAFVIIPFQCNQCQYDNKIGVKKGKETLECPSCNNDIELNWD